MKSLAALLPGIASLASLPSPGGALLLPPTRTAPLRQPLRRATQNNIITSRCVLRGASITHPRRPPRGRTAALHQTPAGGSLETDYEARTLPQLMETLWELIADAAKNMQKGVSCCNCLLTLYWP